MSELKVPQLRFPEFSGEWTLIRLDKVIDFRAGYAFKSSKMSNSQQVYQLIKMSNVYKNILRLDRNPSYWKAIDEKQLAFLLKDGDTVLTLTGTIGKRDYGYSTQIHEDNKYLLNQRLVRLREIKKLSSNHFIYNLVSNERFLYHFFINSKGGTGNQSNVSVEDLKSLRQWMPKLPEQEKIASFFFFLYTKIEQLSRKAKLLENYKKGVMQKIFSQEIRFNKEDGSAFAEWEEKKLGDYGILLNGLTYSPDNIVSEGLLVLRSSNIQNKQLYLDDNVYVDNQVSEDSLTKEDDILICVRNGSKRLIGKSVIIPKSLKKSTHGAFMTVFRGKSNKFIAHWFQTPIFYKQVHQNLGATINSINGSDLKKFKTFFPQEEEQTKIATFLTSIDTKIEQNNKQLDQAKLFKKALLQQMFV